jgi:hypothetical protein
MMSRMSFRVALRRLFIAVACIAASLQCVLATLDHPWSAGGHFLGGLFFLVAGAAVLCWSLRAEEFILAMLCACSLVGLFGLAWLWLLSHSWLD